MNIKTITPTDAARWEAFVESCPKTIAWQSYHWSRAVDDNYNYEFHPIAAEDDGRIRGIFPLYRLRGQHGPTRLISVPFAVAGGIAAETDEAGRLLLDAGIELATRLGSNGITLKQYRYPAPGDLKSDTNYFNRELDLSMGHSRIWDQLADGNKQEIEAAEKDELTLEYPVSNVTLFYDILLGFLTRSGVPCPARRWIQTLLDLKMYSIALLRRNGRPAAATMIKTFKTTVSFPYTCMADDREPSVRAAYALYWRVIKRYADEGYKIFHSGRMPNSEDVPAYRRGWGGEKHQYYYQYHPNTGGATEYGTKRGWKRTVFLGCYKLMPKPLAEVVGPRIVAKFP
jgi:hypothetical protein